jgi:hypothetical protein
MPQVLGTDHIAFAAHDLEATCVFYDQLFGARTHFNWFARSLWVVPCLASTRLAMALISLRSILPSAERISACGGPGTQRALSNYCATMESQSSMVHRRAGLPMGLLRTRSTSETRMAIW